MKKIALVMIVILTCGCAEIMPQTPGAAVFDTCKVADGASTVIAVSSGKFHEANPLLKGIVGGGMGWFPFTLVMAGVIGLYNYADNKGMISEPAAVGASAVTCGVAARNIFLMTR